MIKIVFYLVNNGQIFRANPHIFEDDCTVEGDKKSPTQSLESEESTAAKERLEKTLLCENIDEG